MLRPEDAGQVNQAGPSGSKGASPAGASPVPVSAGAPGSRPQAEGENPPSQAGCQKPLGREQERGPQHEVKPAASTQSQWGSRAAHVTAKATPGARKTGSAASPSRVWGAARVQGEARNTGDPSAQPQAGQGGSYKPKAKSSAVQRKSEGVVVLKIAVTNNAAGGKDPCFGRAQGESKCEGMVRNPGPNHPDELTLGEEARESRSELWARAKRREQHTRRASLVRKTIGKPYGRKSARTV